MSEQEKADFLEAGVQFKEVTRSVGPRFISGPRGEAAALEIGEDDPRWGRVDALLTSLEGNDQAPKLRVQDVSMARPTFKESLAAGMASFMEELRGDPGGLGAHSGQTLEQLLSLQGRQRIDSLVLAFEEAINQKVNRSGSTALTEQERIVLAVEALEREVNNGGYEQFFMNSSREFAPVIVDSLRRIGCKKTAEITQRAIKALNVPELTAQTIEATMVADDKLRLGRLRKCDDAYYKTAEPIAERLFAFIKANRAHINIP
jgi:hypothetical protein